MTNKLKPWAAQIFHFIKELGLILVASVLLVFAIVLALLDKVAAGSLIASLFIVISLFHFLPQMESFKAFGVEAKWRERLKEADELLEKLRQSALTSSLHGYSMLGWGSRLGGFTARLKRDLANQIDGTLKNLDVDLSKVIPLKGDYLLFSQYDLFQRFDEIVALNIRANLNKITQQINELPQDQNNEQVQRLTQNRDKLSQQRANLDLIKDLPTVNLADYCNGRIPFDVLPEHDAQILREFTAKIISMLEKCKNTQSVSDEAVDLIDQRDRNALYRSLFSENP
jgi:hypothetical protein